MKLEQTILEMTQELESKTVEWIYRAIEKTRENDSNIYPETNRRLDEKYGKAHSRDKVFATPAIKAQVIEELIGTNVYNIAMTFIYKGASRNLRNEIIIEAVKKDYDSKRKALQTKIEKLAGTNEIVEISSIDNEGDKLSCFAYLDDGSKIQIYTIPAGGWNIQKFHFRGLAKRLK